MIKGKKIYVLIIAFMIGITMSINDLESFIRVIDDFQGPPLSVGIFQFIYAFVTYSLLCWLLFWINGWCEKNISGSKKILYSVIVVVFFCLVGYAVIKISFNTIHFQGRRDKWKFRELIISCKWLIIKYIIILIVSYVTCSVYNLSQKKKEVERKYELLKVESLESKLRALNTQMSPHFFFNALNSLHSLIIDDEKEKSLAYLVNLSNVFRYILQSEKKGMVKLSEELNFIDTYKFLQLVKYGNKLKFNILIDDKYKGYEIPVLSLLPVIENVTKHNEVSNMFHMEISITIADDMLVISNPKHERLDSVASVGFGLKNLNNRYKLLVNKEISVENSEDIFVVCLPLIPDCQA